VRVLRIILDGFSAFANTLQVASYYNWTVAGALGLATALGGYSIEIPWFWILISAAFVAYVTLYATERLRKPAYISQLEPKPANVPNDGKGALGRRYTTAERDERYNAWSRIYKVLSTSCSTALDKASYVSNTWKEEIINATPKGYRERMAEASEMISASLLEITLIYREYEYLIDIKRYFEDSWGSFQSILYPASNILSETVKRMPENMTHNLVLLLEPQAQEYRKGVKLFGVWITEAKKHASKQIGELSRD
jgi:hypothetical protein